MWPFKPKQILLLAQENTIGAHHVSWRPTRLGIALFVVAIGVWIGAVNYQANVAYLICFWIICFVLISALLTRRQLLGLQIDVENSGEVFAGQTAHASLKLHSTGTRARQIWWRGEWTYDAQDDDETTHGTWCSVQLSGSLNTIAQTWEIDVFERGYFPEPLLLRLASTAPFGLFSAHCLAQWHTDALVFPAPLAHEEFGQHAAPDPEQTPQQAGMHGEDIAYLNNHQPGASLQHIAWKVYAKRGEMMDKVFDEPPHVLHNNLISYQDYPQRMSADKLAGLLTYRVLQAEKNGVPYTLVLPKTRIAPQNSQREKCLAALALM